MKQVSRFEANLLRIVHGVLQRAPLEKVLSAVTARVERPPCLSRDAVELLQDTLSRGTVWLLAREGWWTERFIRGSQVKSGRLWQRTSPHELGLPFSEHALRFLLWLTAWHPEAKEGPPAPPDEQLEMGDRLLTFLTYRLLRGTDVGEPLRQAGVVAGNGLCRLMFPDDFAELRAALPLQWNCWINGVGSCVLEALQAALARRWIDMELGKGQRRNVAWMRAMGERQTETLSGFLEALASTGRWDLARFLLDAYRVLLADSPSAQRWIASLKIDHLRLSERTEAYRSAVAFLRHLERLQQWTAQARAVGYFDEGYAASQLWKADWESHEGDELCLRAANVLREVEPLGG